MKNISFYPFLLLTAVLLFSCKQDSLNIPHPTEIGSYRDSISFTINDKLYTFNQAANAGVGNRQINIKPYPAAIPNRRAAYETGGYYWYGIPDSTLYSVFTGISSPQSGNITVSFNKKFKESELTRGYHLLVPKDHFDIFRPGNQPFAVDLDKENTVEGIAISANLAGFLKGLTTAIPGFSIMLRAPLTRDLQNNSIFQITKVEKLKDDHYLVEAKFKVNLYDEDAHLHRAENGFLRITTAMRPYGFY